jgi:Uma2 family endonuclease
VSVLIQDRDMARSLKAQRQASDAARFDEVWDGVYVVAPVANYEHQWLAAEILVALHSVLPALGGGKVMNGINVSDREDGWVQNYRVPDLAVILASNSGKVCDAHFFGGPDFVVEIISPEELAREKLGFYAKVGVRELLVIDRDPWALELFRLAGDELTLVCRSTANDSERIGSEVLPLTFSLESGSPQPQIVISRTDGTQTWTI